MTSPLPKRKKFLHKKAVGHHQNCIEYHGGRRIPTEDFYKKFEENVIENNAGYHHQKVAEQLGPTAQVGRVEHDDFVEVKTEWKSNEKCKNEGCNVGTDRHERKVQDLFVKNIIVGDEEQKNVQQHISTSTSCIIVQLLGHPLAEQGIKSV